MIGNSKKQTARAAYTTPDVKAISFCSAEFLTTSPVIPGGGGHTPLNPDPGGDIEDVRRKIFEYDFTLDESLEE